MLWWSIIPYDSVISHVRQNLLALFTILVSVSLITTTSITTRGSEQLHLWTPGNVDAILNDLAQLPFDQFVEKSYLAYLSRFPQLLKRMDDIRDCLHVRNNALDDYSPIYIQETQRLESGILNILETFPVGMLSSSQRITLATSKALWQERVDAHPFADSCYAISTSPRSLDTKLQRLLLDHHPWHSCIDAEDYVLRLGQVGRQLDQIVAMLQRQEGLGVIAPSRVIDHALASLSLLASGAAEGHPFYRQLVDGLTELGSDGPESREEILQTAVEVIGEEIIPAYLRLRDELRRLRKLTLPGLGLPRNPDGREYYEYLIRHYTGLDLTPTEVHELGLREVERLEAKVRIVMDSLNMGSDALVGDALWSTLVDGGSTSRADFAEEVSQLINAAQIVAAPAFETWPPPPVKVIVSDDGPLYDTSSNTFHLPVYGMWNATLTSLVLHEVIPGHHVMNAVVRSLTLPTIQQHATSPGFVEGWAVYAENLMAELGYHKASPFGRIDPLRTQLTYAAILVVDTGIHSQGWTDWDATVYLSEKTGIPRQSANSQILQFAAWPGQAVSYLIGARNFLSLRERTRASLEDDFDLAAFHSALMAHGYVAPSVLETVVGEWVGKHLLLP